MPFSVTTAPHLWHRQPTITGWPDTPKPIKWTTDCGTENGGAFANMMQRVGVNDTFAESGPYLEVIDKYGLTAPHIAAAVEKVLARK